MANDFGQLIVLNGVTAAYGQGAARIEMTAADRLVAKMSALSYVVKARALTPVAGGGVAGRCQLRGTPLIPKGTSAATLTLSEVGGKRALGITGVGRAGLALPPGSFTSSYTAVITVNVAAADAAGNYAANFLSAFTAADVYEGMTLRYDGAAAAGARPNKFSTSNAVVGNYASIDRPTTEWVVLVVDYNNYTRTQSIGVNRADILNAAVMPSQIAPGPESYLEIGYHLDPSSLRSSKVGDLYLFNDSVASSALGRQQLIALVNAVKAEYGIA